MIPTDDPSLLSLLLCVSGAGTVLVVIVLDIISVLDVTVPVVIGDIVDVTILDDTTEINVTGVSMPLLVLATVEVVDIKVLIIDPMEVTGIDVMVLSSLAVKEVSMATVASLLNISEETGMIVVVSMIGTVEIVRRT